MPGTSNLSGDQSIFFGDNASFDGTHRGGILDADGKFFVGSSAGNADAPNNYTARPVRVGYLDSSDGSIDIVYSDIGNTEGKIDLTVAAANDAVLKLRTQDLNEVSPSLGIINVSGGTAVAGTSPVTTVGVIGTSTVTTNVQLTQTAAGSDTTKVGLALFDSTDFTVTDGFVALAGAGAAQTLTPDWDFDGTAATAVLPQAGNINVLGYNPSPTNTATNFVTGSLNSTGASTGNLQFEHRAWTTQFVVDASTTVGTRGTYSTIAAAISAASSGQTIFIRAGTYTENLTLKAGVNLAAYNCDAQTPNVTITGKCTYTGTGVVSISGIRLKTNGDYCLQMTGANVSVVILRDCFIECADNNAINFAVANASSQLYLRYCSGEITGAGISYFTNSSTGQLNCTYTHLRNTAGSTTASTFSAGNAEFAGCILLTPLSATGTASVTGRTTNIDTTGINVACATFNASGSNNYWRASIFNSGTATSLTVTQSLNLSQCVVGSGHTNAIDGAGTLTYGGLVLESSTKITTTSQIPYVFSNDAIRVTTPGAYAYTTLAQDAMILVDSAGGARTIIPQASPATGQKHIIKDASGNAAANNITVTPSGKNIDGAASYVMNINYGSITIVYNGTEWNII